MKPFIHRILSILAVLLLALPTSTVRSPVATLQGADRQSRPATAMAAPAAAAPITNVTSIAAGETHTCAVVNGGLKCWGGNTYGQLGSGTTTNQLAPEDVPGLTSGVNAVTAGVEHTCALTGSGGVKCWGSNDHGQLGDNSTVPHAIPADVSGLTSGVQSIDAGRFHTCALVNGGVVCWGNNTEGEDGDGSYSNNRLAPVNVSGLSSGISAISAGWYHSLALTAGGGMKCWGGNWLGQCGDGTTKGRPTPVNVSGLTSGVAAISGGARHTCAVTSTGGVKCWGANGNGQLGNSNYLSQPSPVDVSGLTSGITAVAAGAYHTCALTSDGRVKCWGSNDYGQLGDGSMSTRATPVEVPYLSGVIAITTGANHTCAITSSGGMKCWGANESGQLGDGTTINRPFAVDVLLPDSSNNNPPTISEGDSFPLNAPQNTLVSRTLHATDPEYDPLTWSIATPASHGTATVSGANTYVTIRYTSSANYTGNDSLGVQVSDGRGGVDTITVNITVTDTMVHSNITSIAAGEAHTCTVVNGGLKCWGSNTEGQLGDGTKDNQLTPEDVPGLASEVNSISAGEHHTCALTKGGKVKCWGENKGGQLGDNSTAPHSTPADVSGLTSGVQSIDAGRFHTCALTNGGVMCWGNNADGEDGDGSSGNSRLVPVNVVGLSSGVKAISAGWYHSLALTAGGGVKCWGGNWLGQCGDGSTTGRSTPVNVSGLTSGVAAITGGARHTCAVTSTGGVKCWGANGSGQLGNGTFTAQFSPVDVSGLTSGITAIAAGAYHTCALSSTGRVKCWGSNDDGQLGDGTGSSRATPVEVPNLSNVIAITAGANHTCAIINSGRLKMKCWGANESGQLGDGTTTNRLAPVDVLLSDSPGNHDPVISEGDSISFNILMNSPVNQALHAADQDNDPLTWSISTQASHGTATISGSNTSANASYTPYTNYSGNDSFVVQVSDGYGGTDTITMNITIYKSLFLYIPLLANRSFNGPLENEPNNSCAEANGPIKLGQEYQGYPNDQKDFFYFDNGTVSNISVTLKNHTGNGVQLQLFYQSCENRVAWDYTSPYSLTLTNAQPGRYIIYIYTVSGYNTATKYILLVSP